MKNNLPIAAVFIFILSLAGLKSIAITPDTAGMDSNPILRDPDPVHTNPNTDRKNSHPVHTNPDTVRAGIYITSIHNIDFKDREYTITFWLWLKYNHKRFDFLKNLEIPNAKKEEKTFITVDSTKGDTISILMKVQCVMKDSWRINKFPFDKQKLWLTIENSQYSSDSLIFVPEMTGLLLPDMAGWPIDKRMRYAMRGWKIDSCNFSSGISAYETAFDDENIPAPHSEYSAFKIRISISHVGAGLLFCKIFLGMYIAFLIAYVCLYIQPANYDSRFQLSVGALFATIGNKYVIEASLPESTTFTLVDSLHALTLFFILLTIAATIISLRIVRLRKKPNALKFDMIAGQLLLLIYIICNVIFISKACSG
jgi:hypothetical protein